MPPKLRQRKEQKSGKQVQTEHDSESEKTPVESVNSDDSESEEYKKARDHVDGKEPKTRQANIKQEVAIKKVEMAGQNGNYSGLNVPKPLVMTGNMAENWKKFQQSFTIYCTASAMEEKEEKVKVAVFLNLIGEDALELYNTLELTKEQKESLENIITAFENHCIPRKSLAYNRALFFRRQQAEGETFEEFLQELRTLSARCEFRDKEDMLRDRITIGLYNSKTQEKLMALADDEYKLDKVIKICRNAEITARETKAIRESAFQVHAIRAQNEATGKFNRECSTSTAAFGKRYQSSSSLPTRREEWELKTNKEKQLQLQRYDRNTQPAPRSSGYRCGFCNSVHRKGNCPAYGKRCSSCLSLHHFAICCKTNKWVRELRTDGEDNNNQKDPIKIDSEGDFFIDSISYEVISLSWQQKLRVENTFIIFKLDTGSDVNILPLNIFNTLKNKNIVLEETNMELTAFGGFKIKPVGVINLKISCNDKNADVRFLITDTNTPLLGLDTCVELGLIKRISSISEINNKKSILYEYKDVFGGLGKFPGKYKIKLKANAQPIAKPPRRIPLALKSKVLDTLNEMEKYGIIKKVEEAKEWVHPLVIIEKGNGKLRLCVDPRDLNNAIVDEFSLVPTLSDLAETLNGAQYYTVLDLTSGFWQIELEDSSSDLCCFSTPFGLYKYLRLPFGIKTGPAIFQRKNFKLFGHIKGVTVYMDDLLIAGRTREEHDQTLLEVFETARKNNVKFNEDKLQFCKTEVRYLGHIFSKHGIALDPERTKAISKIAPPENVKDLQRFLGIVNYVRDFVPNFSQLTAPLRELIKKMSIWKWLPTHQKVFEEVKRSITEAPTLGTFDPEQMLRRMASGAA